MSGKPAHDRFEIVEGPDVLSVLDAFRNPPGFHMITATDRDGFIKDCLAQLHKFTGLEADIKGDTEEARAKEFFKLLVDNGIAIWEK